MCAARPQLRRLAPLTVGQAIAHVVWFGSPILLVALWRTTPVNRKEPPVLFLLWLLAVILVVAGIVQIVRGAVLFGVVLIILGLLVGPGGVSIFH